MSRIRLGGVAFAVVELAFLTKRFPPGYLTAAWALTGAFAFGTVVLLVLTRLERDDLLPAIGFAALVFDTAVIAAYAHDLLVRVRQPDALGARVRRRGSSSPLRPARGRAPARCC